MHVAIFDCYEHEQIPIVFMGSISEIVRNGLFKTEDRRLFRRLQFCFVSNIIIVILCFIVYFWPIFTDIAFGYGGSPRWVVLIILLLLLIETDYLFWKYLNRLKHHLDEETVKNIGTHSFRRRIGVWRIYYRLRAVAKEKGWV